MILDFKIHLKLMKSVVDSDERVDWIKVDEHKTLNTKH